MILLGDCLIRLKELPDNSVDSVVTDPPYGLKFMGKKWDCDVPSIDIWREVLRVLKPGGHLLSFGGTRTYHRMVSPIEDAGFEIRDQISWLYGSGFPKSHDISKGIDKAAGAQRERYNRPAFGGTFSDDDGTTYGTAIVNTPATDAAKQWQGWGTALKPANEPIVLARKPLSESTVAKNVLKWGVGGLNIDASRIGFASEQDRKSAIPFGDMSKTNVYGGNALLESKTISTSNEGPHSQGRWPANLLLDETAAEMLGEPARFFYCAKSSKSERNAGLEGEIKEKQGARPNSADASGKFPDHDHRPSGGNNHPTVKPIRLMEYLIKLITPPNGTVLDPFAGSGSTGVAAVKNGFKFIGCEMDESYKEIAEKRIAHASA